MLDNVRTLAFQHNNSVKQRLETVDEVEYHFDLEKMYKGFNRLQNSEKLRRDNIKNTSEVMASKRADK